LAEIVAVTIAGADLHIYIGVNVLQDGRVAITGLAREGFNTDGDPFVRILASRPGCLSIRCGRELILGYEHGSILTGGENLVFVAGPVRHAREMIARAANVDDAAVPHHLDALRSLVREMVAHGHGGLLVISPDERPLVPSAPYRMSLNSSIGSLLRLAQRIKPKSPSGELVFARLLRNAFLTELERAIEEVGFGSRGTPHRAAASYASDHPGAVVFVASEDGQVSCLFRDRAHRHVLLWRLGSTDGDSARRIH